MIQAYPTKHGTGVSIYGDYGDLNALYETVHHMANSLEENNKFQKGQHQLLTNFAYEIRKAFSGSRLKERFSYFGHGEEIEFYGFQIVWTDILIFISVLRHNAGYIQTNKLHQGSLYYLEYIVEKALFDYDAIGANNIKDFICQRINILNICVFQLYQALHISFVLEKPGKARFRKIPDFIINHFSSQSNEHRELIAALQNTAKDHNCEVTDLEQTEFPDIKW